MTQLTIGNHVFVFILSDYRPTLKVYFISVSTFSTDVALRTNLSQHANSCPSIRPPSPDPSSNPTGLNGRGEQAVFTAERSTTDQIFAVRQTIETFREHHAHIAFIYFNAACDAVARESVIPYEKSCRSVAFQSNFHLCSVVLIHPQ